MYPKNPSTLHSGIKVAEALPVRTQFMIFTLFGEFVMMRGGKIWTSSLLYMMGLLGISERAVRSTLSRMTRKGWISAQKFGRRSQYIITARGRALLEGGQRRIFEPIFTDWNNQWHMVVYSLPEKRRRKRHALRKQLTWLGFGRLAPGTWISPHDRRSELKAVFSELNIEIFVDLFSGIYLGPSSAQDLVQRCWDLNELEARYQDFIARFQPLYEKCLALEKEAGFLDPQESFVQRFWLIHEFQSIPLSDPNLPTALLPHDWIGYTARTLLDNYRQLLRRYSEGFVDEVMSSDGKPIN